MVSTSILDILKKKKKKSSIMAVTYGTRNKWLTMNYESYNWQKNTSSIFQSRQIFA
jgi:hypothetical protein